MGTLTPLLTAAAAPKRSRDDDGSCKSDFVGVRWDKRVRRWQLPITERITTWVSSTMSRRPQEAYMYDTAARRLRPDGEAHGGRSGTHWQRLNFPTAEEAAFAAQRRSRGCPVLGLLSRILRWY